MLQISKQLCVKLGGDMHLDCDSEGNQVFNFFMHCADARKIIDADRFPSSQVESQN